MQIAERFWSKVAKGDGCWEWTASRTPKGYGQFRKKDGKKWKTVAAHRFALEISGVEIRAGMFACHTCDNPSCVRPDHLWLGTNAENMQDSSQKGRLDGRGKKSHCKHGHEFTAENTLMRGRRQVCRECSRVWRRKYEASHRLARAA